MDSLEVYQKKEIEKIPELVKFVLIGREQLHAVRAAIRAIDRLELAESVREQKLKEAQALAESVLDAEIKIGELTSQIPTRRGIRSDLQHTDSNVGKSKKDVLRDAGISVKTAERFEKLAAHKDVVTEAKKAARESGEIVTRNEVLQAIKSGRKSYIVNNSGESEWYTPPAIAEAVRELFGRIDLDPASCESANKIVQAEKYYTKDEDGLSQEWTGIVFLNPPYDGVKPFIEKLAHSPNVTEAVVLTNNATETGWFQLLSSISAAVVFPSGRLHFYKDDGEQGACMQGQAITYAGSNPERFLEIFGKFGWGAIIKKE